MLVGVRPEHVRLVGGQAGIPATVVQTAYGGGPV
ncbi:TOBE domain-containing protein [Mesorhizobium sp.]|nr:MAG: TOBE domain-containing protein [Mesorhizobium sp.]